MPWEYLSFLMMRKNKICHDLNEIMKKIVTFAFNAVELYVVTINKKPWTCVKEGCKALGYGKAWWPLIL